MRLDVLEMGLPRTQGLLQNCKFQGRNDDTVSYTTGFCFTCYFGCDPTHLLLGGCFAIKSSRFSMENPSFSAGISNHGKLPLARNMKFLRERAGVSPEQEVGPVGHFFSGVLRCVLRTGLTVSAGCWDAAVPLNGWTFS